MKAWDQFLKQQERELGIETVNKWLRSLKIIRFDACNLHLEAKDAFQGMWFEEHIRKKVEVELLNNNHKEIKVHLTIPEGAQAFTGKNKRNKDNSGSSQDKELSIIFDDLDPIATFDHFVDSESNILAHKLLCKITHYDPISKSIIPTKNDLAAFNPIYLFGGEGSGKTHLLMATAHALRNRLLNVVYVRAQTFTEHVVRAIRSGKMNIFRSAYRHVDVLLIDDVHVFSSKGATQEELFHTFNHLHLGGKQIILSANCAPAELQHIEPRLVSRFEWGIVLPLDPFNEEDVRKILRKKIDAFEVNLHQSLEEFLLTTFTNSTKTLIQALETLILKHQLKHNNARQPGAITIQLAKHLLKDLIEEESMHALTPEKVIKTVAEYFGIKVEDVLSKLQSRECVLPRQLAMFFCRTKLKLPYKQIGELFYRDHSTVMSSVKLIEKNLQNNDKEIETPFSCITKMLNR